MTAKELKAAGEQWQKQYQYNTGTQLQWMTKQEASCMGYERVSRTPRMTRHGTSTPESAYVYSPQFLHDVRFHWQESVNNFLNQYAPDITERIDMRSYKEQKNNKIPQLHLGPSAAKEERKQSRLTAEGTTVTGNVSGYLSALNREIRRHNHMIDLYSAQEREAMQIDQEAERQAALLEVYRRQWISARCYDISLTKQFQRLRVRYGYEDESKLQKNQQLLNQAFRKVRMKEELLHTTKQQVSESKERYLKQKALVPVRIKHLVASYQTRYRQEFTASQLASAIGETMQLVQQVEESILREEEQVEWQQRQQ